VEEGAYVVLQVKYGLIRLINTKADLCENIQNVDLECPIKKGKTTIKKDADLPAEIPPVSISAWQRMLPKKPHAYIFIKGKYTVLADVYTKDDAHITCLTATVVFQS
jgi:hypothetical protein